jgi:hypothetical protein
LFWSNLPADCIDTGFYGGDIFLAVIGWPILDEDMRSVAERTYDPVRCPTAQS